MEFHETTTDINYKIICKNYPAEFLLDKNIAKEYFRQFGKLKRLTFRPKLRICSVEYTNKEDYLNALNNSGEYKGTIFQVTSEKTPKPKRKIEKLLWMDDDEVQSELQAMAGSASKSFGFSEDSSDILKDEKLPKLKRAWTSLNAQPKIKKLKIKPKPPEKVDTLNSPKNLELIKLIKSQAITVEEKFKVLDARDKLIRINLKKKAKMKSSSTVGACPDMCPEKERLMRETQHQVALYEQEQNGKSMDPSRAIKQYSRSSADQEFPLPHELRPVTVLQMTMAYLMHNIIDMSETNDVNLAEWYHFLWDRTRGIRKDITQQELCSQGAVELVEQCARFHIHCSARLVAEDPSVFDQKINTENLTKCLQSLKYMYHDLELKGEHCPNEAEFRAYIILLNLNDGNFMWEVQELRQEIQKSEEVKFALQVYSALDKNNYVKFFKLVYSTTYLNSCILMRYFVQVRVAAIKTLLKCYTSRAFRAVYPLYELKQLLAFDDIESTTDLMQAYGLSINEDKTHIILEKNTFMVPEIPYVLDRSLSIVESKRTSSVGRTVCGKELPLRTFEDHIPQNSFDEKGYLVYHELLEASDIDETEIESSEEMAIGTGVDNDVKMIEDTSLPGIFGKEETHSTKRNIIKNIFAKLDQEDSSSSYKQPPLNIFSQPVETQSNFGRHTSSSIFGNIDQPDSISSNKTIFERADAMFKSPFTESVPVQKTVPETKRGGFYFELPIQIDKPLTTPISQQENSPFYVTPVEKTILPTKTEPDQSLQQKLKQIEEEAREKLRQVEEQKKQAELEIIQREYKKRQEELLKKIKKQKQEEQLMKRMKEMRQEEQRQRDMEIKSTVKLVLKTIVEKVDEKICLERLEGIKEKIQKRKLLGMLHKWRQVMLKNKRKRKAMDCSPVWVNTKSLEQAVKELHTSSQELTLKLKKRYKYGKAFNIDLVEDEKVSKIDLLQLTYPQLSQRFFTLKGTLQKNIFWKVGISLPDHYELQHGLSKIEDTLTNAFEWEDRNGTIMKIEQINLNSMQSITYCIERQKGLYARYADANGIIFIARDYNTLLQRRIIENLKEFGVYTKIPIVIILQEYKEGDCDLRKLVEMNIVSGYIILIENLVPYSLIDLIKEGLLFLARQVQGPPPLELDTLKSFLQKYLCTEIWNKAKSFAKFNKYYRNCLRNPMIIISLYNEALSQLRRIVLNKSCFEYPNFPEVFKNCLQSDIPDYLPCNYLYFPKFWKSESYVCKLDEILKSFHLPQWSEVWPPSNELDLEVIVSKYCTKVFIEPNKPFTRILSVLLKDIEVCDNFDGVKNVLWTDIIEVLTLEKLQETNFSLSGTSFDNKSIFNQFVVVYHINELERFNRSDWYYICHPLIKKYVEEEMKAELEIDNCADNLESDLTLSSTVDLSIYGLTDQVFNKQKQLQYKKQLLEFSAMLTDLEDSIKIDRKMSSIIGENLKRAISED